MRDIAVVVLLLGCIILAFRRPWWGVLGLAMFGYLNPHRYAWGFATELSVYLILFLAVVVSFLINAKGDRQTIPRDWRVSAFYILWFWYFISTLDAIAPAVAWPRLVELSKVYLPLILTLVLINNRQKLFYLIAVITASFGLVAVKGGIFAIGTGFAHRTYGPPYTHFYGNNEFAIATLMVIPLVILCWRETKYKWLQVALAGAIPLMFVSAVSSQSRGALVAMAALVPVLLWHSKRKYLAVPVLALGLIVAADVLPQEWFGRMETIRTFQEDKSAMGRIRAWQDGLAYALSHPLTGGGFDSWPWITEREWHSAYVEILAEHGFIGFLLWFALVYGTLLSLTRLPRLTQHIPDMRWVSNYAYMLRASLVAYAAGSLFLGITYWDLLYHVVFLAVLVKTFALEELSQHAARLVIVKGKQPWAKAGAMSSTAQETDATTRGTK